MNPSKQRLALALLPRALCCACPDRIPRSGSAGARVNCFSVYIDKSGGEPYLLVRSMVGTTLHCYLWTGSMFDQEIDVDLRDVDDHELSITHFYGYAEVQYKGIVNFAVGRTLFLPYLRIHLVRAIESVDQYFFNKKKLVTKQRIDLLRFLIDRSLEGRPISSTIDLMTDLYSIKWVLHPDRDPQQRRLQFYLDSLVDTGELNKTNHGYELTGKALQAIELYEEQERKHTEGIKAQRRMVWLTLAIALLTAAQAGVFKLPTLIDLRSEEVRHDPSLKPMPMV